MFFPDTFGLIIAVLVYDALFLDVAHIVQYVVFVAAYLSQV